MYTTYHLQSAEEITSDVVEAIKSAFKSKPIKLTVEEDDNDTTFLLANPKNKAVLMAAIEEDKRGEYVVVKLTEE